MRIEQFAWRADKSDVDRYWLIDEELLAGIRRAQSGATAAQPSGAGTDAPFLTRIEQALGEGTEPDAAFFVDSWTVGVAAASENFLRRNEEQEGREHNMPMWDAISSCASFFVGSVEASVEAAWPLHQPRVGNRLTADPRWRCDEEENDWQAAEEAEMAGSLSVEAACRMLGVSATSTREQIRAAYRRMASRYHPDRLAGAGDREQKLASDRMASINQAYRLLCAALIGPWSTNLTRAYN